MIRRNFFKSLLGFFFAVPVAKAIEALPPEVLPRETLEQWLTRNGSSYEIWRTPWHCNGRFRGAVFGPEMEGVLVKWRLKASKKSDEWPPVDNDVASKYMMKTYFFDWQDVTATEFEMRGEQTFRRILPIDE